MQNIFRGYVGGRCVLGQIIFRHLFSRHSRGRPNTFSPRTKTVRTIPSIHEFEILTSKRILLNSIFYYFKKVSPNLNNLIFFFNYLNEFDSFISFRLGYL